MKIKNKSLLILTYISLLSLVLSALYGCTGNKKAEQSSYDFGGDYTYENPKVNPHAYFNEDFTFSDGFNLKNLEGGEIVQEGGGTQTLYITGITSLKYYLESDIYVCRGVNNNNSPKVGLIAGYNEKNTFGFMLDPLPAITRPLVLTCSKRTGASAFAWASSDGSDSLYRTINGALKKAKEGKHIKLGVARDGSNFYFFVNDEFIQLISSKKYIDSDDKSCPGFMTINMLAKFTNIRYSVDSNEIDALISAR